MRKQQYTNKQSKENIISSRSKNLTTSEAIKVLKENMKGNFDHTFELQVSLKLPEKNKKDVFRFSVVPEVSFSKPMKVIVLAEPQAQEDAKKAGADRVGLEDLVAEIEKGWSDFDILIATPTVMPKIAKLGKILGPKGLMPNPKTETVTTDFDRVIGSYKKGKIDVKSQEGGLISFKFGKLSMTEEELVKNLSQMLEAMRKEIGKFEIAKTYLKTTMSPSLRVKL